MASFTKVNDFVAAIAEAKHDFSSDSLVIALSNTAPGSESNNPTGDGNGVLANVTQVAYTYCSSRAVTISSHAQTSGTFKLVCADLTLSASGGSVGPFRYVYLYNDTATNDELIGLWDKGESVTLSDGESIDIDFDGTNGVFDLT